MALQSIFCFVVTLLPCRYFMISAPRLTCKQRCVRESNCLLYLHLFTFTPVWFSIWYGSDQLKTWCTLSAQPPMWLCLYCANDAWCHLHSCHTAWWAGTDEFRHEIHLSFISLEPLIVLSLWTVKVCLGMGLCLSVWCEAKWFCVHLWLFDDYLISVWVCVYE